MPATEPPTAGREERPAREQAGYCDARDPPGFKMVGKGDVFPDA